MSDPVFEAAERAVALHYQVPTIKPTPTPCEVDAARELAKTLMHIHRPVRYINKKWCCVSCYDENGKPALWPCISAPKIYSTEQLEEMRK